MCQIISIKPGGANCYIVRNKKDWILIDVGTKLEKLNEIIIK